MKTISLVVNLDTRKGWLEETTAEDVNRGGESNAGARSLDFLLDGVENKRRFFHGLPLEVVLYIDVHEPLPDHVYATLHRWQAEGKVDVLCFARHRKTLADEYHPKSQDLNYVDALGLARGTYVAHFDADMAAFAVDQSPVRDWIDRIERGDCDIVSYPSKFSPKSVHDPSYDYQWASTRFFLARRSTVVDSEELRRCLASNEHLYGKYGDRERKNPWTEHILGLMVDPKVGGKGVWYPPLDGARYYVFSWSAYRRGLFAELGALPYHDLARKLEDWGGVQYPCNILPR